MTKINQATHESCVSLFASVVSNAARLLPICISLLDVSAVRMRMRMIQAVREATREATELER